MDRLIDATLETINSAAIDAETGEFVQEAVSAPPVVVQTDIGPATVEVSSNEISIIVQGPTGATPLPRPAQRPISASTTLPAIRPIPIAYTLPGLSRAPIIYANPIGSTGAQLYTNPAIQGILSSVMQGVLSRYLDRATTSAGVLPEVRITIGAVPIPQTQMEALRLSLTVARNLSNTAAKEHILSRDTKLASQQMYMAPRS